MIGDVAQHLKMHLGNGWYRGSKYHIWNNIKNIPIEGGLVKGIRGRREPSGTSLAVTFESEIENICENHIF